MKKKLAALLLAAASAMVFTGCGSSDNQSKGGVDKKVQIEYWHVASESFGGTTVKELVADFNAKHPNIQVVEKYNPDMYKGLTQNLQAAIASGKNPDVVQMGWSYLNYAAENLKYTDLQPMIEKQAPEDKNFLKENYLPNVLALAQTDDGKQIGIPYSISVPVLFYNPEIFTAAGLDPNNPPKTWKEVVSAAKQIKEKTGNMGFFMQEYADNWTQQAIIESNGGSMLKNEAAKSKPVSILPKQQQRISCWLIWSKTAMACMLLMKKGSRLICPVSWGWFALLLANVPILKKAPSSKL